MKFTNKIIFVIIFIIFLETISLFAQEDFTLKTPELIPYRKGNKWGYVDRNKKIIIPIKYDFANAFRNGIAQVRLNKKTGFIDKNGN